MLGTPIDAPTSTRATDAHLTKGLEGFREIVSKLSVLPDSQCAHSLQRTCLGLAKVL